MEKKTKTQSKKTQPTMQRQGDILLIPSNSEVPKNLIACKPHPTMGTVLAVGSATGHTHRFPTPEEVDLFEVEGSEDRILVVKKTTKLVHDQHKELTVPAGTYTVRRQRVFTAGNATTVED